MLAQAKQKILSLFKKSAAFDAVGIAIHPDSIDIVALKAIADQFQVELSTRILCEISEWHSALDNAIKEFQLDECACQVVLAGSQYQVMQVDKPQVPDEEMSAALKWSVKDIVQNSDELAMDYFDIPAQNMGTSKINLVTSKIEQLQEAIEATKKLTLQGVTIEELALCSLLPPSNSAALLITQQPGEDLRVMVVKDGALFFTRTVAGFAQMVQMQTDLANSGIADSLSLELQRSMDYFEAQLRQAPITQILVGLPMEYNDIILQGIKMNFDIDIQPFNINLEKLSNENLPDYIYYPALGAAYEVAQGLVN